MSDVPITTAHLAGLFVSCILYGFHIVSFAFTLRSLAWAKSRWGDINVLFLVVACFLLGNASFDLILDFQQAVKAFVYNEAGGGPLGVFENISNWANVTKSLSVVVQTLVGDAMLIYRCFIIYSRSYLVILLPVILWLGGFAATIWVIYLEATLHSRVLVTAKQLRPSGSLFWGLTIALNVITTSLLVWRIWRLDRRNKSGTLCGDFVPETRRLLRDVVRIIVESGLLYTASALATFVIFICKSNAIYVITGAVRKFSSPCSTLNQVIRYLLFIGNPNSGNSIQPHYYPCLHASFLPQGAECRPGNPVFCAISTLTI
ncbi:hypothetical protein CPC08DRAFT_714748 [Agrocybe pediades]|nr:hypothetical protein CPC08DRAFT_714748 [Agrocybe pediades]